MPPDMASTVATTEHSSESTGEGLEASDEFEESITSERTSGTPMRERHSKRLSQILSATSYRTRRSDRSENRSVGSSSYGDDTATIETRDDVLAIHETAQTFAMLRQDASMAQLALEEVELWAENGDYLQEMVTFALAPLIVECIKLNKAEAECVGQCSLVFKALIANESTRGIAKVAVEFGALQALTRAMQLNPDDPEFIEQGCMAIGTLFYNNITTTVDDNDASHTGLQQLCRLLQSLRDENIKVATKALKSLTEMAEQNGINRRRMAFVGVGLFIIDGLDINVDSEDYVRGTFALLFALTQRADQKIDKEFAQYIVLSPEGLATITKGLKKHLKSEDLRAEAMEVFGNLFYHVQLDDEILPILEEEIESISHLILEQIGNTSSSQILLEASLYALSNLVKECRSLMKQILEENGLRHIIDCINKRPEEKLMVQVAIDILEFSTTVEKSLKSYDCMSILITLLWAMRKYSKENNLLRAACNALYNLSDTDVNRRYMIDHDAFQILAEIIDSEHLLDATKEVAKRTRRVLRSKADHA